jgi:hypothetical protein
MGSNWGNGAGGFLGGPIGSKIGGGIADGLGGLFSDASGQTPDGLGYFFSGVPDQTPGGVYPGTDPGYAYGAGGPGTPGYHHGWFGNDPPPGSAAAIAGGAPPPPPVAGPPPPDYHLAPPPAYMGGPPTPPTQQPGFDVFGSMAPRPAPRLREASPHTTYGVNTGSTWGSGWQGPGFATSTTGNAWRNLPGNTPANRAPDVAGWQQQSATDKAPGDWTKLPGVK